MGGIEANKSEKLAGGGFLLGAALITGSFGLWVRLVSPMLGTAAQTVARFALASAIIGGIGLLRKRPFRIPRKSVTFVVMLGLATFGLGLLFTTAARYIKIADAMALLSAGSIITALLGGTCIFKEKLTVMKVLAVVVAIAGILVYIRGFQAVSIGMIAGLCAGVCDGASNCVRKVLRGVNRQTVVMYQYAIGAVLALPVMLSAGQGATGKFNWLPLIALICYALLSVSLGTLLLAGFGRLDANVGAVVLASQIFFAMLLGILFLHEQPTMHELAGGVLIFSASFFTMMDTERLRKTFQKKPVTVYGPD